MFFSLKSNKLQAPKYNAFQNVAVSNDFDFNFLGQTRIVRPSVPDPVYTVFVINDANMGTFSYFFPIPGRKFQLWELSCMCNFEFSLHKVAKYNPTHSFATHMTIQLCMKEGTGVVLCVN